MNSINEQQPEENTKNLEGAAAIKKIQELVKQSPTCFLCSDIKTGLPFSARPMSVQKVDDDGNFWFLIAGDSHTREELAKDPLVQLLFQGSAHSDFLCVSGAAAISTDKEKIKELWEPIMKVWFTEGIDDPRITVLKIEPAKGHYWDNKHGNAIAFVKMTVGAIIGKTLDDSIEGKLEVV